jgi:hypothetical protein
MVLVAGQLGLAGIGGYSLGEQRVPCTHALKGQEKL